MKTDRLYRAMRIAVVFLAGIVVFACKEDNPENPENPEPPGPELQDEVVVHNYSNDSNSKVEVLSIDYGETGNIVLTIDVPKNQVPKVNEYLVSAPTKLAPYGYLLKVTKVTEEPSTKGISDTLEDIKVKVEGVIATINEVIKNISIDKVFYIPLPDVSFEQFKPILEGLSCKMTTWTEDDPVILEHGMSSDGNLDYVKGMVTVGNGEEIQKGNKVKLTFDAFEIDGIKIKPDFSFVQKGLYLFLEVTEGTFQKIGFDYEANFSCSLEVQSTYKGKLVDQKWILGSLVQNYVIPAGDIPVVVTVVVPLIIGLKIEGSVGFTFKPVDVDYDIGIGAYYDFPRESFFPCGNHEKIIDITDNTSQKEYVGWGNLESDLTLKGNVSLDPSLGVSVGLYGCNIIDRKAGWMINGEGRTAAEKELMKAFKDIVEAEVVFDAKVDLSAELGIGSVDEVAADLNIKDDCGLKLDWGATIGASLKIPFFGNLAPSWKSPRGVIFDSSEDIKWPHTLFFSEFSKIKIIDDPENDANLVVSAIKSKPLFGYQPYKECSFGLCFVPSDLKNNSMGMLSQDWKMYDLSGNPDYMFEEPPRWREIYERIPKSEFEYNRFYDVYMYTEIDGPLLGNIYLLRANKKFRLSEVGGVSTVDVEDIPGQDL